MRVLVVTLACVASLVVGCSDEPDTAVTPTSPPITSPAPTEPSSGITVSDAVPTLDELRELGLSEQAAMCFIETIDPEGTGRVASAELFAAAWATCL